MPECLSALCARQSRSLCTLMESFHIHKFRREHVTQPMVHVLKRIFCPCRVLASTEDIQMDSSDVLCRLI